MLTGVIDDGVNDALNVGIEVEGATGHEVLGGFDADKACLLTRSLLRHLGHHNET